MKQVYAMLVVALCATPVFADTAGFDRDAVGTVPRGWTCGVTGVGAPRWSVETDDTAPSKPNVLKQTGSGAFPWCVVRGGSFEDGFVEVKYKPIQGREDQAAGVVWRFKDGDNYYVARANALENNVSLYHTTQGTRRTIQYVDAPVAPRKWHVLRVEFAKSHIKVLVDSKLYIERDDTHITGPGAVGVWTKADSVTAFDDFAFGVQK